MPLSKDELLKVKESLERELTDAHMNSARRLAIQDEIALINSCLCGNKVSQERKAKLSQNVLGQNSLH